jgi:hypothetical protein
MYQKIKIFLIIYCIAIIALNAIQMSVISKCKDSNPQILINLRWLVNISTILAVVLLSTLIVYYGLFKECNAHLFGKKEPDERSGLMAGGNLMGGMLGRGVQASAQQKEALASLANKTAPGILVFCILIGLAQTILHSLTILEFRKCKGVNSSNNQLYSSLVGITFSVVEMFACGFMFKD